MSLTIQRECGGLLDGGELAGWCGGHRIGDKGEPQRSLQRNFLGASSLLWPASYGGGQDKGTGVRLPFLPLTHCITPGRSLLL